MNSKFNPTSSDLAIAPRLERWSTIQVSRSSRLRGDVTGHPILDDQRIITSPLVVLDSNMQWARTTSRFYVLGEPAHSQPTELEVARRHRLLQRQCGQSCGETMHQLYVLSDFPNIARVAARRTTATRLDGRAILAIMETAHSKEIAELNDAEICLLNQLMVKRDGMLF